MKIEITDNQIDEVVLYEMKRHSKLLESSLSSLKRRKLLKKFEKEDIKRYEEVLKAMKVILEYYGSHLI